MVGVGQRLSGEFFLLLSAQQGKGRLDVLKGTGCSLWPCFEASRKVLQGEHCSQLTPWYKVPTSCRGVPGRAEARREELRAVQLRAVATK